MESERSTQIPSGTGRDAHGVTEDQPDTAGSAPSNGNGTAAPSASTAGPTQPVTSRSGDEQAASDENVVPSDSEGTSGETSSSRSGASARRRRLAVEEPPPAAASWTRVFVVIGGLLVIIIALFVANRLHSTTSTSSGSSAANASPIPTVPSPTVPPTLGIKGGTVAAIVNGHSIPTTTYRAALNYVSRNTGGVPTTSKALGQRAMNFVIANEVVGQYAAAHHISLSSSELNTQVNQFRSHYGGEKGFQQWLGQQGLTFDQFKALLAPSLLEAKVERQVIHVPAARVRHILIGLHIQGRPKRTDAAAHALAQQLLSRIQHGANFAQLARKQSDDTSSAVNGGNLGNVYPHMMVPAFDHAVFTLPLHRPTLVHTQFGYHIVEVLSRVKIAPMPQSAQDQQALQSVEQQLFSNWIGTQVKRASVKKLVSVG